MEGCHWRCPRPRSSGRPGDVGSLWLSVVSVVTVGDDGVGISVSVAIVVGGVGSGFACIAGDETVFSESSRGRTVEGVLVGEVWVGGIGSLMGTGAVGGRVVGEMGGLGSGIGIGEGDVVCSGESQ